jgi:hypothetical protein
MKPPPDNPEFAKFTAAMRHIMGVSKTALTAREETAEKKRKQAKTLPASPDSGDSNSVSQA